MWNLPVPGSYPPGHPPAGTYPLTPRTASTPTAAQYPNYARNPAYNPSPAYNGWVTPGPGPAWSAPDLDSLNQMARQQQAMNYDLYLRRMGYQKGAEHRAEVQRERNEDWTRQKEQTSERTSAREAERTAREAEWTAWQKGWAVRATAADTDVTARDKELETFRNSYKITGHTVAEKQEADQKRLKAYNTLWTRVGAQQGKTWEAKYQAFLASSEEKDRQARAAYMGYIQDSESYFKSTLGAEWGQTTKPEAGNRVVMGALGNAQNNINRGNQGFGKEAGTAYTADPDTQKAGIPQEEYAARQQAAKDARAARDSVYSEYDPARARIMGPFATGNLDKGQATKSEEKVDTRYKQSKVHPSEVGGTITTEDGTKHQIPSAGTSPSRSQYIYRNAVTPPAPAQKKGEEAPKKGEAKEAPPAKKDDSTGYAPSREQMAYTPTPGGPRTDPSSIFQGAPPAVYPAMGQDPALYPPSSYTAPQMAYVPIAEPTPVSLDPYSRANQMAPSNPGGGTNPASIFRDASALLPS